MQNKYMIYICFIALTISQPVLAMRCDGNLVYEGDSAYTLVKKCGEPLDKLIHEETVPIYNAYSYIVGETTKTVEVWIYQRSPVEFRYEVIFENGRVKEIKADRSS